jgi:hypothetical protein
MAQQSMTSLKSMSIEKLVKLQSDVEAMLSQKVSEQRHSLEQELSKLGGYTGKKAKSGRRAAMLPSIVIPKRERPGQGAD